jgi:hypothetical protein
MEEKERKGRRKRFVSVDWLDRFIIDFVLPTFWALFDFHFIFLSFLCVFRASWTTRTAEGSLPWQQSTRPTDERSHDGQQ